MTEIIVKSLIFYKFGRINKLNSFLTLSIRCVRVTPKRSSQTVNIYNALVPRTARYIYISAHCFWVKWTIKNTILTKIQILGFSFSCFLLVIITPFQIGDTSYMHLSQFQYLCNTCVCYSGLLTCTKRTCYTHEGSRSKTFCFWL